jgi:hypothetical protein
MTVFTINAQYTSDRFGHTFTSAIDTDTVFADRLTAEMAADFLNLMSDGVDALEMGLHGNDYPDKFFVTELTVL